MNSSFKDLEKAYKIADWMDDPWSSKGRSRYLQALKRFEHLLKHQWFKEVLNMGKVAVLDIGAGKGIGGVALVKILLKHGVLVDLVMIDVREDALKDAKRFATEEDVKAETRVLDALKTYELGRSFDIILAYGAILAHFNDWSLTKLFASLNKCAHHRSIVVIEERNRVNAIFKDGFKEFLVENRDPENLSISVHLKHDVVTGSYYRAYIKLKNYEITSLPINFRNISTIASLLWIFFQDVDLVYSGENEMYFVLGKSAREKIRTKDILLYEPTILKRKEPLNLYNF